MLVPTPRLRGGFKKLDPRRILANRIDAAASLSHGDRWSEETALADIPRLDAVVCNSVAVTRDGQRCGKGEGYSDLEFAILRELGHPPNNSLTGNSPLHCHQISPAALIGRLVPQALSGVAPESSTIIPNPRLPPRHFASTGGPTAKPTPQPPRTGPVV